MDPARTDQPSTPSAAKRTIQASPERRHSFRVRVPGRASIWRRNQLHGHYGLQDLSLAGCALCGGPSCCAGEHVQVVLHFERGRTLELEAEVRRSDHAVGLRFEHPSAGAEDQLQDRVVSEFARTRRAQQGVALLVDGSAEVRRRLCAELEQTELRVAAVATPLDALQVLLDEGERVAVALIGTSTSTQPLQELSDFIARSYPHVRRVRVGSPERSEQSAAPEAPGCDPDAPACDAELPLPCAEGDLASTLRELALSSRWS